MLKYFFIFLLILFTSCSCKVHKTGVGSVHTSDETWYTNKNSEQYNILQKKIITKSEALTSFDNKLTLHFKKFISSEALKEIEFKEWRQNIYIEFTVDKNKQILYYNTNTSSNTLDLQIKIAFKSYEFDLIRIQKFDPIYKYNIVVVQNINNKPVIKCNEKAIGYIPPVFKKCVGKKTYDNLNRCNYMYITDYLYNTVDLTSIRESEIDNKDEIYSKFIVDKEGVIISAKIESKNKYFLEAYHKALKSVPPAIKPAQFNNKDEYYGYNFPTSIFNIVSNNNDFKEFYSKNITIGINKDQLIKSYLHKLHKEKNLPCNYHDMVHTPTPKNILRNHDLK